MYKRGLLGPPLHAEVEAQARCEAEQRAIEAEAELARLRELLQDAGRKS